MNDRNNYFILHTSVCAELTATPQTITKTPKIFIFLQKEFKTILCSTII